MSGMYIFNSLCGYYHLDQYSLDQGKSITMSLLLIVGLTYIFTWCGDNS